MARGRARQGRSPEDHDPQEGKAEADGHVGQLPHGPPDGILEEVRPELDALWEDLVTTLPSLPGRRR